MITNRLTAEEIDNMTYAEKNAEIYKAYIAFSESLRTYLNSKKKHPISILLSYVPLRVLQILRPSKLLNTYISYKNYLVDGLIEIFEGEIDTSGVYISFNSISNICLWDTFLLNNPNAIACTMEMADIYHRISKILDSGVE